MLAGPLPDYPFRWSGHDRLVDRRLDAGFLAAAWSDPATRVVVMRDGKLAADDEGLVLSAPEDAPAGDRLLLGAVGERVYFLVVDDVDVAGGTVAASSPDTAGPPPDGLRDLRRLTSVLAEEELSLAVHATALGGWHRRHPKCSVCGHRTDVVEAGAARRCPGCGSLHFPRTDPAVIMLVVDDEDRCLLGHNAARPDGWFSTLAGFVEPGESPEQAVIREVREEAGIEVDEIAYAGSQPWPFPSSLMLGFFAHAASTQIAVDGDEITEARWFTREELAAEARGGTVVVPTTISIAGALVSTWFGGPLPEADT